MLAEWGQLTKVELTTLPSRLSSPPLTALSSKADTVFVLPSGSTAPRPCAALESVLQPQARGRARKKEPDKAARVDLLRSSSSLADDGSLRQ